MKNKMAAISHDPVNVSTITWGKGQPKYDNLYHILCTYVIQIIYLYIYIYIERKGERGRVYIPIAITGTPCHDPGKANTYSNLPNSNWNTDLDKALSTWSSDSDTV